MSGPPANGNGFCVSQLLQLRGRRQSYKSMLKKGQLAPAETQGPSLTRARQMEQMTGTNGAYIGVTATHSCTLPQTDGRTCRCRTNHPSHYFLQPARGGLTQFYPAGLPAPATRLLLIRPLHGVHAHARARATRRISTLVRRPSVKSA